MPPAWTSSLHGDLRDVCICYMVTVREKPRNQNLLDHNHPTTTKHQRKDCGSNSNPISKEEWKARQTPSACCRRRHPEQHDGVREGTAGSRQSSLQDSNELSQQSISRGHLGAWTPTLPTPSTTQGIISTALSPLGLSRLSKNWDIRHLPVVRCLHSTVPVEATWGAPPLKPGWWQQRPL